MHWFLWDIFKPISWNLNKSPLLRCTHKIQHSAPSKFLSSLLKLFSPQRTIQCFRGFTIVFEILCEALTLWEEKSVEMFRILRESNQIFFPCFLSRLPYTDLCLLPAWPLPERHCWPEPLCPTRWAPDRHCWGLLAAGRNRWRCGSTVGSLCVAPLPSCAWLICCCQGAGTCRKEKQLYYSVLRLCFCKSHLIQNQGASHPFTKGSEVPPDLTAVRFLAPLTRSSTMPPLGRVKLLVFLLFRNPFFTEGGGRNEHIISSQVQVYLCNTWEPKHICSSALHMEIICTDIHMHSGHVLMIMRL